MTGTVFNQGTTIEIAGERWIVRETPYGEARRLAGRLTQLVRGIREARPDLDFAKLASEDTLSVVYDALPILIGSVADVLEELTLASVRRESDGAAPDVKSWPSSAYLELLAAVFEEHREAIEAFFGLLRVAKSIKGNGTQSTRRPGLSRGSSAQASDTGISPKS